MSGMPLPGRCADLFRRLHGAQHIGGVVQHHQAGAGLQGMHRPGSTRPCRLKWDQIEAANSGFAQMVQGPEHRVVLQAGAHHMAAGFDQALDQSVEGVGGVG
jgi:hypothetical protein